MGEHYHPSFASPLKWRLFSSMKGEIFKWSFSGAIKRPSFSALDQQECPAEFKWQEIKRVRKRLCMCVYVCTHTHTEWVSETKMARGNDLCFLKIPSF